MNFYELDAPSYMTENAMAQSNPVQYYASTSLPGVTCQACGEQWAGSDRVRVDTVTAKLVSEILNEARFRASISFDEFTQIREFISVRAGLSVDILTPGAVIGPPEGEIWSEKSHDFIHPFPGMVWVRKRVKTALEEAGITGCSSEKVQLRWGGKMKRSTVPTPELWELVVRAHASREGTSMGPATLCSKCGRTSFPDPENLAIDQEQWDGSDVFNLDGNPNIVIVSEKVKDVLDANRFTNYVCRPI